MVAICDVGPRDGLQNEATVLIVRKRVELVERLAVAGVGRIEVGSFVNRRLVPAMAATADVVERLSGSLDDRLTALVLSRGGYEELARTRLREVRFALVATETFNRRNARRSVGQSLEEIELIVPLAHSAGRRASVTIGAAFGCPFEGAVDPGRVLSLVERLTAAGVDEVVLADTIGVAVPRQVRSLVTMTRGLVPVLGLHLHNTRNAGYANVLAAIESGADLLDASVGGIGGCPFAPNATGNVATEDVVYLLEREGVSTGVDLDRLIATAAWLAGELGHRLEGAVHRAGTWFPTEFDVAPSNAIRTKEMQG